jgi:hypothetical protein
MLCDVGLYMHQKMIHHMNDETDRVMDGTVYEGRGQFYHNTLMIMMYNKRKSYMSNKDLIKYWQSQLEGLQQGTCYHNSTPR